MILKIENTGDIFTMTKFETEFSGIYRLGDWVVEKNASYTQPLQVQCVEFNDNKFYYGLHNGYYLSEDELLPYKADEPTHKDQIDDITKVTTDCQDELVRYLLTHTKLLTYIIDLQTQQLTENEMVIVNKMASILRNEEGVRNDV